MKSTACFKALEDKIPKNRFRTRFAPSPTGYMHLGGLRTALYAYLLAKKNKGDFLLRIEDTDQERFVEGAAELIYDTLKSAGIHYDEGPDIGGPVGPYIQSERREIYNAYADLLVQRGGAYLCFCTKDELNEQRSIHTASRVAHKYDGRCSLLSKDQISEKKAALTPYVIRQRMSREGITSFFDTTFGRIDVENSTLDDGILIKSDGLPTYNFANVIDDHLMGITHIIRGSEFISSTPRYILLYESFGWDVPEFTHCSPIMRDASNKLSKRDGDAYFSDFIERGYLTEALINYIALLGWSPGGKESKFTLNELESVFDVKGISKDPSIFDYKNLNALNGLYIRNLSDEDFYHHALPFIEKTVKRNIDTAFAAQILKERCELFSEIPELLSFVDNLPDYSPELYENKKMGVDQKNAKEALHAILPVFESMTDWNADSIKSNLLSLAESLKLKNGRILWPLRVALSGKTYTPGGGAELSYLLGKDESINRIKQSIKIIQEFKQPVASPTETVKAADPKEITRVEVSPAKISMIEDIQSQPNVKKVGSPLTDEDEINRIAAIAKLDVSDCIPDLQRAFSPIMSMLDRLKNLQLSEDDFTYDMTLTGVMREDIGPAKTPTQAHKERERLLKSAPSSEAGCISVPKIFGKEE